MMTAEQLKVSLYLLLFSGKLTEQLADDGTTKELLKRIEKKQSASKKALKIIKKESGDYYEVAGTKETYISDELLFDIPDNWAWVHLNEIAVSGLGKTLNKSKDTGDTKKYLCSINVYWDGIHLDEVKEAKFSESDIEKYKLMKGDLLICEGGDAGRTAIWEYENEMYYQNALHRVRFWEGIDPYYFRALMEFYKLNGTIDSYCKGMTIKHLVQGSLNAMRFPLPPLAEQKRIVAKIEELMPFVEQYVTASTKLNTLNTSFPEMMKKSILQEAVQGKLVPQDPNDEPASLLLKKIAEEKKRLIKEGKIKKQKPLPEITEDEIPFDIPESWEWVRFAQVVNIESNLVKPEDHQEKLQIAPDCIGKGNGVLLQKRTVEESGVKSPNHLFFKGQIIYSKIRPALRKAVEAPSDGLCSADMYPLSTIMDNHYTLYYILSDTFTNAVTANANRVKMPKVNQEELNNVLIPVPPLSEQRRIAKRLDILIPQLGQLFEKTHS